MGTPWELDVDGAILFFEDYKAPPYYVDGDADAARSRREAPRRSQASSSARWRSCDWGDQRQASDWARSRSLEDVLEQHLEPLGVPVLYRLPLGHGKHLASHPARRSVYARRRPEHAHARRVPLRRVKRRRQMKKRWLGVLGAVLAA